MAKAPATKKNVVTLTHEEASRKNIPTAEYQSVMRSDEQSPIRVAYEQRNPDIDPQLVWRGKDDFVWNDLVVPAPPLYIQEKVHPKVLIDDLKHQTESLTSGDAPQFDLFSDFNGLPSDDAKTEFYQHDAHWSNRMILGDSLQAMSSLAEREGLRGKVQCIYIDPPYGIRFNSNFQWSTTSRDVKDGNIAHITREPEQVKAFRDTWRDGIHSYLTYLRDRLIVARDLLAPSGSLFLQIGDENAHRVQVLMDEVFGPENAGPTISYKTTSGLASDFLAGATDHLVWYFKDRNHAKYRRLFNAKNPGEEGATQFTFVQSPDAALVRPRTKKETALPDGWQLMAHADLTSTGFATTTNYVLDFQGKQFQLPSANLRWKTTEAGMKRLDHASRLLLIGQTPRYRRLLADFPVYPLVDLWTDTGISGFADKKVFVVQTSPIIIQRCILMTTDPGDLVLDPTCGSGTTAYVAEQWGRRWITIDTSRVAMALARARVMGAKYPYYLLADSPEGVLKEAQMQQRVPVETTTHGSLRQGFVYDRVPHVTLRSIANNAEIDVIWERYQDILEPLRTELNRLLKTNWQEWNVPREADDSWSLGAREVHERWWERRRERQFAIETSIGAKAEFEYLYDKPFEDNKKVRVAGPFTVESLSPHRVLAVNEDDEFIEVGADGGGDSRDALNFVQVIIDNLQTSGVQQAAKDDKIVFSSLTAWPGERVSAEGRFLDGDGKEKRAAVFVGPEFGTVSRPDLVSAAREAGDAAFDVLIACAFNYDAHSSEFNKLGRIPVLKARMNADLHMAADLKNTGKGNLFVIFGEPDIKILDEKSGQIQVKVNGIDVFHPSTGEVRSDGPDGIACWFVDTDYNEESFFVRQAYFLGANDPYKALKATLKAEINEEAWTTLHSDTSRPFPKPVSGRIAVKVINHLGDEVMKVFKVN